MAVDNIETERDDNYTKVNFELSHGVYVECHLDDDIALVFGYKGDDNATVIGLDDMREILQTLECDDY